MKKENKSLSAYFAAGIVTGVLSFLIGDKLIALALMIAIAGILVKVLGKILGEEKIKWWIGNGVWIYIFVWAISWTILYNL